MPRRVPTTLRPRICAQARGGSHLHHVPNRPPRFPTSTPPPGPSAHHSGFSIRSQQDSIGCNPTAFKAPVRTSVATEFNPGERRYNTISARHPSIRDIRDWCQNAHRRARQHNQGRFIAVFISLRPLRLNLIGTGHWNWPHSAPPQVFVQPACAARTSPLQARNHVKQYITF